MLRLFRWIKAQLHLDSLFLKVSSSIAFFPSLIAIPIFIMGLFTLYMDERGLSYDLTKHIPYLITRNPETARSMLSSLTGGMFSLMVFSFSMVMVVLTLASSNYTPRVLPGLISTKQHQIVLGLYLGTISFLLIVHLNTGGERYDFDVPVLSIFLAVVLVICCFAAFVSFIHGISQNIQIGNILANLYKQTRKSLKTHLSQAFIAELPSTEKWALISSDTTGYFQGINEEIIAEIGREQEAKLMVLQPYGAFLLEGMPLLKSSKPLPEQDVIRVQEQCNYYHQERISTNYLYGFKQITEVANKALSPGINDPGTALTALDYLTQLFVDLLQLGKCRIARDRAGNVRIFYKETGFEEVFYMNFASIRNYGASDIGVQQKLLHMLAALEQHPQGEPYKKLFVQERRALMANSSAALSNERDIQLLAQRKANTEEEQ